MLTTGFSIYVALIAAVAILLFWIASAVQAPRRNFSASFAAAAGGAILAGIVIGAFFALFDYPIIWP